ncbi:MAG: hypothetical protein IGQ88_07065, partial [Gloeomargaritaceae cyanobacterium C42_A2020_066]|nr:hypothetical protein [Gloeomargaritaceae cyanobacterium C42_A2020_066]
YRPDLYAEALHHLGRPDMEPSRSLITLFDGMVFSPDDPLGYLHRLDITHPFTVAEFPLDRSIPA